MAYKQMGVTQAGLVKEFIGTIAEQVDVPTDADRLGAGSTYWASDEKAGYVWDGTAWQPLK